MSHWAFVAAAYGVTVGATGALLVWAHATMRRAEAAAEALRRK
jgi:hypothetical protein